MYISVALHNSKKLYSYYCHDTSVKIGDRVLVPVNNHEAHGIVKDVNITPTIAHHLIKTVICVIKDIDIMTKAEIQSFKDELDKLLSIFKKNNKELCDV